uniref:Uncharacterized protein n=1 Tax=Panagrolaimus sp. PS1159 TaxID=55785 RepID=A0AC35FY93_9BILA
TVHKDEFQKKQQDRAAVTKPKESGILKGDGKLNAISTSANEYTVKRGERYEKAVPKNNQILNSTGKMELSTTTHDDYHTNEGGDRFAVTHHADSDIFDSHADFDGHTIYNDNFIKGSTGQRITGVRPSTALKLGGSRELISGYQAEFQPKVEPCVAGELVESVKKDHKTTKHFEFNKVSSGHHFYESKS